MGWQQFTSRAGEKSGTPTPPPKVVFRLKVKMLSTEQNRNAIYPHEVSPKAQEMGGWSPKRTWGKSPERLVLLGMDTTRNKWQSARAEQEDHECLS